MKRILSLLVIAAVCSTLSAATIKWPGWTCTDQAVLTAALQQPNLPANAAINITVIKRLAENPAKNFAELAAVVDEVCAQHKAPAARAIMHKKQIALCRSEFLEDAWKFCLQNPSSYDFYYYKSKRVPIASTDRYHKMMEYCIANTYVISRHAIIHEALNCALDNSDEIPPEQIKKDLQLLNRKMSKNLLQDKAGWEPVIATIRTTLECY